MYQAYDIKMSTSDTSVFENNSVEESEDVEDGEIVEDEEVVEGEDVEEVENDLPTFIPLRESGSSWAEEMASEDMASEANASEANASKANASKANANEKKANEPCTSERLDNILQLDHLTKEIMDEFRDLCNGLDEKNSQYYMKRLRDKTSYSIVGKKKRKNVPVILSDVETPNKFTVLVGKGQKAVTEESVKEAAKVAAAKSKSTLTSTPIATPSATPIVTPSATPTVPNPPAIPVPVVKKHFVPIDPNSASAIRVKFKTEPCNIHSAGDDVDKKCCQFFHTSFDRRRSLLSLGNKYSYSPLNGMCPNKGCFTKTGQSCNKCHNGMEVSFHPLFYKRYRCSKGKNCANEYCPNFHNEEEDMSKVNAPRIRHYDLLDNQNFECTEREMSRNFKTQLCPKDATCMFPTHCFYYHTGKHDKRRNAQTFNYGPATCEIENCVEEECPNSHNAFETNYCSDNYKKYHCNAVWEEYCLKGKYCSFKHKNSCNKQFHEPKHYTDAGILGNNDSFYGSVPSLQCSSPLVDIEGASTQSLTQYTQPQSPTRSQNQEQADKILKEAARNLFIEVMTDFYLSNDTYDYVMMR